MFELCNILVFKFVEIRKSSKLVLKFDRIDLIFNLILRIILELGLRTKITNFKLVKIQLEI